MERPQPPRLVVLLMVAVTVSAAPADARTASTERLLRDCRDAVVHGAYTERSVRRALGASPPEPCPAALRFELAALSVSDDVLRDCYEDGRLGEIGETRQPGCSAGLWIGEVNRYLSFSVRATPQARRVHQGHERHYNA